MFSLAAVMFATFMGYFMSMTLTFCISIYQKRVTKPLAFELTHKSWTV
jgi:putative effector of murein hydrolase